MFRMGIAFLVFFLLIQPQVLGEEKVVLAVASEGETMEAEVSQTAARCSYFLMFDGDGNLKNAVENPYQDTRGGAGVSVADFLAERNVTVFVAGGIGDKMKNALEAHGLTFVEFSGRVEEAVRFVLEMSAGT